MTDPTQFPAQERNKESTGRHERLKDDPWRAEMANRVGILEDQNSALKKSVDRLTNAIDENNRMTASVMGKTDEMFDIFATAKGAFKFAGAFVTFIKGCAVIGAIIGSAFVFWKTGGKP